MLKTVGKDYSLLLFLKPAKFRLADDLTVFFHSQVVPWDLVLGKQEQAEAAKAEEGCKVSM